MISERLQHTTLTAGLLLQLIELLHQQFAHRVRWLKLQWQYPIGGEDPEQPVHSLLHLFHTLEPFIHPSADPRWIGLPCS